MWNVTGPRVGNRRVAVENLKRCPLCGAVNALQNHECFACRWHGEFEHDPVRIEEGVDELLLQCPELLGSFDHEPDTWRARMRRWLSRLGRRIDYRV